MTTGRPKCMDTTWLRSAEKEVEKNTNDKFEPEISRSMKR